MPSMKALCGIGFLRRSREVFFLLFGTALVQALPTPKASVDCLWAILTSQVRFAPQRGSFPKESWT
jgi:hypothetical protein